MAFNPFEAFSIRSKLGRAVMAVLGIVVMLTFVLSTGAVGSKNDFFDQLGGMFSSRKQGEVVAVAYGDDIHEADLREVNRQRQAANLYLASAIDTSYMNWAKELKSGLEGSRASTETKQRVAQFLNLKVNSQTDPRPYLFFINNQQQVNLIVMARVLSSRPDATEDRNLLDAVLAILAHDLFRAPNLPSVFPDILLETDRDRLDFAILLKKADRLGIRYSEDAVSYLVNAETGNRLRKEDSGQIEAQIRVGGKFGEFTSDWFVQAIGNEFRARDAYAALQGTSPLAVGIRQAQTSVFVNMFQRFGMDVPNIRFPGNLGPASAPPGAVTPYEFWEFYKDRCTEQNFSVLEVSAESLLDQVKEEPTQKQRIELFNKYRGEIPDPSKPTPGFKEPRKQKVEFTTLDAKNERVTKAISQVQAASVFLCASAGAISGDPVSALLSASQPGLAETLPIRSAVSEKMAANQKEYTSFEQFFFVPRDWAVFHPRPIAAALGTLAGHPDVATFVAAAAAAHHQVEVIDHQSRVPFLLQQVLTPFNPTIGNALGMPVLAYAHYPKLPAEGLYLGEIVAEHKKRQRQGLFQADVRQLEVKLSEITKDLRKPGAKPDKAKVEEAYAAARKHLDQWLKDRGLTAVGTPKPVDRFEVVTAPELKPLNDAATPEPDGTNSLSQQLFRSFDGRMFGMPGQVNSVSPFEPFWFPAEPVGDSLDKPNHFVWVSEEVPPMAYNSLENADRLTNGEMTKRVDRAWKLEKARGLAKAEADRLAEEVRAIGRTASSNPDGVERLLKDLAAQKHLRKFEIERLAKLKLQPELSQARVTYEPPTIDRKLVVYQTPDFADQLLELRTQPLGAVTVVADAPRTRYYVACVTGRREKTIDQFRDEVFVKSATTGPPDKQQPPADPLYLQYALSEDRGRAMEETKLRLRADAQLEEKEAFKSASSRREE